MKPKVQLQKSVIQHLIEVCRYRKHVQFPGKLFVACMAEAELQKLETALAGKLHQKKATVSLSFAQLVCVQAVVEAQPNNPCSYIILEKVLHPITRQILK